MMITYLEKAVVITLVLASNLAANMDTSVRECETDSLISKMQMEGAINNA